MKTIQLALLSLTALACSSDGEAVIPPPASAPSSPAASSAPQTPGAPAATAKPAPDAPAAATPELGAALTFTAPDGWVAETPTSKMRVAQFKLPKAASDSEDADLVVFNFGASGGGGVEANIERWASQFAQPDGGDSAALVQRSERQVAGRAVTEVRLSGTYVAETTPGSGVRVNKPGYALLAAIVDNGDNDYYVKLTGPVTTVEEHAAAFRAYVSSAK